MLFSILAALSVAEAAPPPPPPARMSADRQEDIWDRREDVWDRRN